MLFAMTSILAIGLLILLAWALFFRTSIDADRIRAEEEAREAKERTRRRKAEARLHRKNEPLRCLNCGAAFSGPLPEDGCPQCHVSSLVVSEKEYKKANNEESHTQTLGKDH